MLVRTGNSSGSGNQDQVFHLPEPDAPEEPRCDTHAEKWRRTEREAVDPIYRLCRRCDPDHDHRGGATGRQVATDLSDADPDAIGRGERETVYLTGSRGRSGRICYHTDPDCRFVRDADYVNQRSLESLPDRIEECKVCSGQEDPDGGGDYSVFKAALEADGDEVPSDTRRDR